MKTFTLCRNLFISSHDVCYKLQCCIKGESLLLGRLHFLNVRNALNRPCRSHLGGLAWPRERTVIGHLLTYIDTIGNSTKPLNLHARNRRISSDCQYVRLQWISLTTIFWCRKPFLTQWIVKLQTFFIHHFKLYLKTLVDHKSSSS